MEYSKLKARMEVLQRNQKYAHERKFSNKSIKLLMKYVVLIYNISRHFMGEDLADLSLKELQSVEQQIDSGLKLIRSRKVISL